MGQVQQQARQFPGFGIVYPDGIKGIKVVGTYTEGPSKIVNHDGSISYKAPTPTVHELFGGGFSYADGSPVTNRQHLEALPGKMQERALKWFDGSRKISEEATKDIPPRVGEDVKDKERPEPAFIISTDMPPENQLPEKAVVGVKVDKELSAIMQTLGAIMDRMDKLDKQIADIKKHPPAPRRMAVSDARHSKQSDAMKAKWADPAYKAKMLAKNPALQGKAKDGENST